MSLHSYHVSKKVLKEVWIELQARYNARMGLIPEDGPVDEKILARQIRELNAC